MLSPNDNQNNANEDLYELIGIVDKRLVSSSVWCFTLALIQEIFLLLHQDVSNVPKCVRFTMLNQHRGGRGVELYFWNIFLGFFWFNPVNANLRQPKRLLLLLLLLFNVKSYACSNQGDGYLTGSAGNFLFKWHRFFLPSGFSL